jgi:alpha-L-fucosidase
VGEWLQKYGDSIYGTRGGPIPPGDWGVTTQKENKIYVHILNWGAPLLALPPIAGKIIEAHSLLDGSPAEFTQNSNGIILKLPPAKNDETDRVVQLILAK